MGVAKEQDLDGQYKAEHQLSLAVIPNSRIPQDANLSGTTSSPTKKKNANPQMEKIPTMTQ